MKSNDTVGTGASAMRYWVYGVDAVTNQPRDPLFLEAESESAARAGATEVGLIVEEVEAITPRTLREPPTRGRAGPVAGGRQGVTWFAQWWRGFNICLVVYVLGFLWWLPLGGIRWWSESLPPEHWGRWALFAPALLYLMVAPWFAYQAARSIVFPWVRRWATVECGAPLGLREMVPKRPLVSNDPV